MNGVCVLTVIVSANRAARENQVRRSFLMKRACQNTKATFSPLPISNTQIMCDFYFGVLGSTCLIYDLKNITMTFPILRFFYWYLTYQGWSPGSGEELRQTDKQTDRHYENLYIDR